MLCRECSDGKLALNGGYNRKIRISLGKFLMRFKRMKCGKYGATHVPLQKLIRFRRYLTKTNEQEKLLAEKVSDTSYCRGLVRLSRNGEIALLRRTAKEWMWIT